MANRINRCTYEVAQSLQVEARSSNKSTPNLKALNPAPPSAGAGFTEMFGDLVMAEDLGIGIQGIYVLGFSELRACFFWIQGLVFRGPGIKGLGPGYCETLV